MNPVQMATPPAPAMRASSWGRYADYLRLPPLLVVEWADPETPARGWLVINSLRGGAAGGGTRMRPGLDRREVTYLAKTMELKFALSGPGIGGAKSGIDFDPADPRREEVLRRWFHSIAPYLAHCYGTGGDLNVDELRDVIPFCAEIGLSHPQEGVVRGHLRPDPALLPGILRALDQVKAPVDAEWGIQGATLSVADMVTGYGLARSIIRAYELQGRSLRGARVLVEGFGAVGGPCALYLAREGALIVGISDREQALLCPEGLTAGEVEALVAAREDKLLPRHDPRCVHGAERERFWTLAADVLVAAAASGSLDEAGLRRLLQAGVHTIACGANQPFLESELGATEVQRMADARFTVVADVVANCGMARAFSHLMEPGAATDASSIYRAVDDTITRALQEIWTRNHGRNVGLLGATWGFALDRVSASARST
ncbi:MAG: amino acid dehydrogenase [Gemmatimonadota bacterium]|nr:amino acid dehydrogenase [Gemmatimonadota bacterium]